METENLSTQNLPIENKSLKINKISKKGKLTIPKKAIDNFSKIEYFLLNGCFCSSAFKFDKLMGCAMCMCMCNVHVFLGLLRKLFIMDKTC